MTQHIAIVGAGLVGSGWAIVFARAGEQVRVFDADKAVRGHIMSAIQQQLRDLKSYDLVDDVQSVLDRIQVCRSLEAAVGGARFVQESVLERLDVK
jgi:3-hydroxyacyl-CoA dehydrogenase